VTEFVWHHETQRFVLYTQNHGYWGYQGGPPPPGYPGYPPQGAGAPTGPPPPETPETTKGSFSAGNSEKKENGDTKKDPAAAANTNTVTDGTAAETPSKDGDEKKEAKSNPPSEKSSGMIPTAHKPGMMPPGMIPGYPHFNPGHHPHMPPPYPGYPYAPHYPPPPHPHFWGPPPPQAAVAMTRNSDRFQSDVDGREGATSPSQIQTVHRDEVQHMGCTCKKTRCLKLYCQCFGVKIYCTSNCRCVQCYNTEQHEKFRQEAMRLILSRNPSAFDTKFKKGPQEDKPETKALAHKLGCKCRKSACMKKVRVCRRFYSINLLRYRMCVVVFISRAYFLFSNNYDSPQIQYCECYAANVKCSSNCRCMGCKNMGNTYYEPSAMDHRAYTEMPVFPVPHLHPGQVMQSAARAAAATRKSEQPIQAAQNLAFLKHASPEKSGSDKENPEDSVNSLMMAAYAMTEFGQGSSPSKRKREAESSEKRESGEEQSSKKVKTEDDAKKEKDSVEEEV